MRGEPQALGGGGSPSSVSSLGNSLMWEKVALSPLELLAVQLDAELQRAEDDRAAAASAKQNKNGVDLDSATGRAAGRFVVEVLAARDLPPTPAELQAQLEPTVYVSTAVTPVSACERTGKKHLRTGAVDVTDKRAVWKQTLEHTGVKSTSFTVKAAVTRGSKIMADVVLGEVVLHGQDFLDQRPKQDWYDLRAPESAVSSSASSLGQLLLRVSFEYSAVARHDRAIAALQQRKKENDIEIDVYKQNAQLLNVSARHPAAFGGETVKAQLYIPGGRFRSDAHHPGAVVVAPLADKTRVVTPFGRGVVVSFRAESKQYVVQLDTATAAKHASVAYLRQEDVKEEPNTPHFRMHMKVATPYGQGTLEEIRPRDGIMVVQTEYAKLFMQQKDVSELPKAVTDMTTKDLIEEAVKLADEGNTLFRGNVLDDAVLSYLRALGFLQRVDQETATHKEKATMLQTMIRCHLNIAACKLKQDAYVDAEIASTNALSILNVLADNRDGNVVAWMGRLGMADQLLFEDWPSKARFRRAQACVKQGKYADAKQDLLIAVKLSPKDKSCRALLDRVAKLLDKQKRDERKAWGGIFENISEDKPVTAESIEQASATAKPQSESSIFTRKTKKQRELEQRRAAASEPWYLTSTALAAASVVTAGVATAAFLALRPKNA